MSSESDSERSAAQATGGGAALPSTFFEYLRSFGPGLVVVLTWLGAGDIVDIGVAGADFGYSLMWVVVVAIAMRFLFVSLIARYQLCNQHGEGVLDGLARLSRFYPPLICIAVFVFGHVYCAYMTRGLGEICVNVIGIGEVWMWAIFWNALTLIIVLKSVYTGIEWVFKLLLAVLAISFLGCAIWVKPDVSGILRGLINLEVPPEKGRFGPLLVAVGMIGAVGGSLMNLVYPYFLEAKGWRGPRYRRLQTYDFLLAIVVMIILNLSVWVLGAQILHPRGLTINGLDDLPALLSEVLGNGGRILFYCGIFAAVYTSLVGHALGLAALGSHAFLRWKHGAGVELPSYHKHPLHPTIVYWCLITSLVWSFPKGADFVTLTLLSQGAQVVIIPFLAGGLWWITSSSRYIGREYRNRWWDNLVMAILFALSVIGAWTAIKEVHKALTPLVG